MSGHLPIKTHFEVPELDLSALVDRETKLFCIIKVMITSQESEEMVREQLRDR